LRVLLPTIRDPDQIGGGGTHLTMLVKGLGELGHDAEALYLTATMAPLISRAALVWPAGALNRLRTGWGMAYSADMRGRMLARATGRELSRAASMSADLGSSSWEVLNAQEVYSVPYLFQLTESFRVPLVLTLHGYPVYESVSEGYSTSSRMGLHYLMRTELRALRLADAVVTVDTRLYQHVLGLVPEREDTVFTLMNFVDTSVFAPSDDPTEQARARQEKLRTSWKIPEDKIVLFCPRRLVKKNGVIYPSLALAAMEPSEQDRFLLLHAGEGGERESIERIITENRLEKHVRLLGGQKAEAIRELYRLADIVLVPSVHSENVEEATSLSALEAMASAKPLIAGNVGGLAEIVVDGETGLLVPADPGALAAAILRLAAAPDLAAHLAAAAREYVVARHSHLRAAAAYADVYTTALAGARRGDARIAEPSATTGPSRHGRQGPEQFRQESSREYRPQSRRHSPASPVGSEATEPAKPEWPSLSVLGFALDVVTLEQAARWAIACAETEPHAPARTRIAVSFNPELVMRAEDDPFVAEALLSADLCYPDGVGAVWAAERQGGRRRLDAETQGPAGALETGEASPNPLPRESAALERVPGIDLAGRVLELAAELGLPAFFLGAAQGVAAEAARRQAELFPQLQVAGTHHGYFDAAQEGRVAQLVSDSGARILLVGMGAPRQETFLFSQRDRLGARVALGVGGSFDVWAGRVKRAPGWARAAKVEWLYRLLADPRRARRQLALPRFAAEVVLWEPGDYGPPRRGRAAGRRFGRSRAAVATTAAPQAYGGSRSEEDDS